VTVPVSTKALLLAPEERYFSMMKWVAEAIPPTSRWYLVMRRYLRQLADRVSYMNGDPSKIPASGTGILPIYLPHPHPHGEHRFVGKIESLHFDRFGDFDGFTLETTTGEIRRFDSREPRIEALAREAWRERLRVEVLVEARQPHRPASIALLV
jgi:hypothetical protein